MSNPPRVKKTALTHNEKYCPVAMHNPLTGYEPKLLDNLLSYSCDAEDDDEIIGKALSSPLFIQEREEPANLRQAYHSYEESLLPAQSIFAHTSTGATRKRTQSVSRNGNQVAIQKTSESGFSLKDKKSKFSLKSELRSRSTNFKPILIEEVLRN